MFSNQGTNCGNLGVIACLWGANVVCVKPGVHTIVDTESEVLDDDQQSCNAHCKPVTFVPRLDTEAAEEQSTQNDEL